MKIIEYAHYDIASNETEFRTIISDAIKYSPSLISVLPSHIRVLKSILPESIKLSSVIDYPLGVMDSKSRIASVEYAIKNGAHIIEMVCPSFFLCNRKYDKFREDIVNIRSICLEHNVELRYILEYRIFTLELLYKVAQILIGHDIQTIYPSTGYMLDDISDNILACGLITKKIDKIKLISNGNIWTQSHIDLLQKTSSVVGIKCHNINTLKMAKSLDSNIFM